MRRPIYAREHETMEKLERHYCTTYTVSEMIIEAERLGDSLCADMLRAIRDKDYPRAYEIEAAIRGHR